MGPLCLPEEDLIRNRTETKAERFSTPIQSLPAHDPFDRSTGLES